MVKAFGRVSRRIGYSGKNEYGITLKLIRALISTHVSSLCRVKTKIDNGNWSEVTTKVKQ